MTELLNPMGKMYGESRLRDWMCAPRRIGGRAEDPQSAATLLTNQPAIPESVTAIPHIYNLMAAEVDTLCAAALSR